MFSITSKIAAAMPHSAATMRGRVRHSTLSKT